MSWVYLIQIELNFEHLREMDDAIRYDSLKQQEKKTNGDEI